MFQGLSSVPNVHLSVRSIRASYDFFLVLRVMTFTNRFYLLESNQQTTAFTDPNIVLSIFMWSFMIVCGLFE